MDELHGEKEIEEGKPPIEKDGDETPKHSSSSPPSTAAEKKSKFQLFRRKGLRPPQDANTEKDDQHTSVEVDSNKEEEEEKFDPVPFTSLFRFATPFELFINFLGLVAAIASGAAQPLMALVLGRVTQAFVTFGGVIIAQATDPGSVTQQQVDDAAAGFRSAAAYDALLLTAIGIALWGTTWYYMFAWSYTGEVSSKRLRERYLQSILRQDIAFFDKVGAGEVATRIQTDTHLVQQGISEKIPMASMLVSSFISAFVVAYTKSWRLSLAMTSIFPLVVIGGGLITALSTKWVQQALKHVAEGGSLAEEVISTIRTAHAFGIQGTLSELYSEFIEKATKINSKMAIMGGIALGYFFFVIYASYAFAFYFGTTLILDNKGSVGTIVTVFTSILIGSFSLAIIAPELQAIVKGRGAAAKLYATIDRVPSIDSSSDEGLKPPREAVRGHVVFRDVEFKYPSRPTVPVLNSLSLEFQAGKTTAIVGASGNGKSTIISLMERFYDPLSGAVLLDGIDIKTVNVRWLRSQMGLVAQEPILFAASIRQNVAHGLIGSPFEHATDEEKSRLIKEACIKSNADGFVTKLPDGYDTLVGERGFLLSGGQKQRIAIARAIVSDPKILLLDEATSALDTRSEGIVQNALDKAATGRTTIVIAHRLSTIKDADQIYVLGAGKVIEQGTHKDLLQNPEGPYAKLVAAQALRESREAEEKKEIESDIEEDSVVPAEKEKGSVKGVLLDEVPLQKFGTRTSQTSGPLVATLKPAGTPEKKYAGTYLFMRMAKINSKAWRSYTLGFLAATVSGAVHPAFAIVYSKAITAYQVVSGPEGLGNPAVRHQLRHDGNRNALWLFIIAIIASFATGVQTYTFGLSAAELSGKLGGMAFRSILRHDIEYFDEERHTTGALTSGLSDYPQKVNGLAGITLATIWQSLATLVVGMIIGLVVGPKLAAVGIACVPFVIFAGYARLRLVVRKDEDNKNEHADSAQLACEAAGSIRTVASLTREKDCCDIYSQSLEIPLRRSTKSSIVSTMLFAFAQSAGFYAIALVYWYGSKLVSTQEYNTNQFFICIMAVTFGAIQAGNAFAFGPDISSASTAAAELITLFDNRPLIDAEETTGRSLSKVCGDVSLEDIHFRYPTRPGVRVLSGLNINVKAGTYVALVGASGCGKSTIIQLIERFYDPASGRVLIDGQDITQFDVQSYRQHVALVSQEPTLYAGTIKFNILLGATKPSAEVSQEELEDACRKANILEFIESLPDKFDTNVGGKGAQLSGGQKQRIAIARALIRNPKVLLLDEATSSLDSQSERVVQAALDEAAKGRTTIAVAHRLSTIQNADCIYFIQEGRVLESGTHEELTASHGRGAYYEYTQLQRLSGM